MTFLTSLDLRGASTILCWAGSQADMALYMYLALSLSLFILSLFCLYLCFGKMMQVVLMAFSLLECPDGCRCLKESFMPRLPWVLLVPGARMPVIPCLLPVLRDRCMPRGWPPSHPQCMASACTCPYAVPPEERHTLPSTAPACVAPENVGDRARACMALLSLVPVPKGFLGDTVGFILMNILPFIPAYPVP
jgi:hypothetical protein